MDPKSGTPTLEVMIRSTILDRPRQLILDPDYIQFDDQDKVSEPPTRIAAEEIEGLRYGVKPIRGYQFRIGRIYCVDIRDISGRIIKIRLKSVYRVRVKKLSHKYASIVNYLYQCYFHPVTLVHYEQFQLGKEVELCGIRLNKNGVLFDEKVGWVSWDFIGIKRYWHYFTLYSEELPDQYRAFVPIDIWNTSILRQLVEMILKEKFPQR